MGSIRTWTSRVVVIFHARSSAFLRSEGNDRLADVDRTVCASGIPLDKPADNKRQSKGIGEVDQVVLQS